jgi:hypothetical protein
MNLTLTTVTITTEHASGNRKSWWKVVTDIDASQRGGYAFGGDFLQEGEREIPVGSLLLHVTHHGSVKNGYQEGSLYAVEADGSLREITTGLNWREQSVTLRKAAEDYLAAQNEAVVEAAEQHINSVLANLTNDDLLAEARRRGLTL